MTGIKGTMRNRDTGQEIRGVRTRVGDAYHHFRIPGARPEVLLDLPLWTWIPDKSEMRQRMDDAQDSTIALRQGYYPAVKTEDEWIQVRSNFDAQGFALTLTDADLDDYARDPSLLLVMGYEIREALQG